MNSNYSRPTSTTTEYTLDDKFAKYGETYTCPYSDPNDYKPFSQMEWRAAEYVTPFSDKEYNTLDTSADWMV